MGKGDLGVLKVTAWLEGPLGQVWRPRQKPHHGEFVGVLRRVDLPEAIRRH